MRVKYFGNDPSPLSLLYGHEYEVIGIEDGLYRVIDEEGYDENEEIQGYLYLPGDFDIVSGSEDEFVDPYADED